MIDKIKLAIDRIDSLSKTKPIKVISHNDTDGITSASIFSRALQRWNKKFSLEITKSLDETFIKKLPSDHILIFLDLASGSLNYIKEKRTEVFIFDHHEIVQDIPENVMMINPRLENHEEISGAAICYLFAKNISDQNKDLASLAVIGMIGDMMEKNLGKVYDGILKDAETVIKRGLLLYPSTRPIDKVLEYSSNIYVPEVTGSYKGVVELLREAEIPKIDGKYKSLYEMNEEEMSKLTTALMLRCVGSEDSLTSMIGNIYLIKFFNKLEDCRELSALINACSRMGHSNIALGVCLGNTKSKEESQKIYIDYKQSLMSALRHIETIEKISGKNYTIINAKNNVKDTIIGTVTSMISNSAVYAQGTIIVGLAYDRDKIKVSARIVGKQGKNVREVLSKVVVQLGGEVGGHPQAAGCLIPKENEEIFITELKRILEIEHLTP